MMLSLFSLVVQTAQLLGVAMPATGTVDDGCDFQWMTQSVDHFNHSNATFQQRYSISTEHFRPGGPALFFQGEETPRPPSAPVSFVPKLASGAR